MMWVLKADAKGRKILSNSDYRAWSVLMVAELKLQIGIRLATGLVAVSGEGLLAIPL